MVLRMRPGLLGLGALAGCFVLGGGDSSIGDDVVLLQKASSAAEGKQFPMNPMTSMAMMNPMVSMMGMMNPMGAAMMAAEAVSEKAMTNMRAHPRVPGFSVVVDSPVGSNFKLNQKMDLMGISPAQFYANTVIIDKYGMRVPQDKAPRRDQYPLIYKYSEPFGPQMQAQMQMTGMPMVQFAPYDGLWHRVADPEDKFEIHGTLMRWSKQPASSPPVQVTLDGAGQLNIMKQGMVQVGRLDGFRILWSDGDVWIHDAKAKSAADHVMNNVVVAIGGNTAKPMVGNRRELDLAFVHIPGNFASEIEEAVLAAPAPVDAYGVVTSSSATEVQAASARSNSSGARGSQASTQGASGALWGERHPALQQKSSATGCSLYATPPKYWPEDVARHYFAFDAQQNRTVTGVLRDPYDKIVNEFRRRAEGATQSSESRHKQLYDDCDVNTWVKEELTRVREDAFADNCQFLPQAEYFDGPHGIRLPMDNRFMPLSFHEVMERHGYARALMNSTFSQSKCEVSAWSLDLEAKAMIKDMYARDFQLLCKHFGYCDADEVTCMDHLPGMCGGAPPPPTLSPEEVAAAEAEANAAALANQPAGPVWELTGVQ